VNALARFLFVIFVAPLCCIAQLYIKRLLDVHADFRCTAGIGIGIVHIVRLQLYLAILNPLHSFNMDCLKNYKTSCEEIISQLHDVAC
jgi:hypothetical protein